MGVSTDAMLVYGYVWDDECELYPGADEDEWEEVVLRKRGVPNPWDSHESTPGWVQDHRAELDAWSAAKKFVAAEFGVDIDQHGSDQWAVPIVKISGAGRRAARGYPEEMTSGDLAVGEDWDEKLTAFCDEVGIDVSEAKGPGWFLLSWWG